MNCELGTLSVEYLSNCIIQTSAAKGDGCIKKFRGDCICLELDMEYLTHQDCICCSFLIE